MRFGLIGHPLGHSVSPAIHQAAYRELGIEASYELFDCPDRAAVERTLAMLRAGALSGINVTIPWKRLALSLADGSDPLARHTGAANVLVPTESGLVAHNTDVGALATRLQLLAPAARRAAVIGSGGAALAAVAALTCVGIEHPAVTARRFVGDPGGWPNAELLTALGAELFEWPSGRAAVWWETAAKSEVVIQATSAGMRGADPGESVRDVIPWERLERDAVAFDVVYNPPVTPFLTAARAARVRWEGGLPMLVGQAESAIELWIGRRPPEAALLDAAKRALGAQ